MNFRNFALTLAAGLLLASAAGAAEHKPHQRAEDRQMSARAYDPGHWRDYHAAGQDHAADPFGRDPPSSANGS